MMVPSETIWKGTLEWHEKILVHPGVTPTPIPCTMVEYPVLQFQKTKGYLKTETWPSQMILQLMPMSASKIFAEEIRSQIRDLSVVGFQFEQCESLQNLTAAMRSGYAGLVKFVNAPPTCPIKILVLFCSPGFNNFLGTIPSDQSGFTDRVNQIILDLRTKQLNAAAAAAAQNQNPVEQNLVDDLVCAIEKCHF